MAFLLGIYARRGSVEQSAIRPMVQSLTGFPYRFATQVDCGRFSLLSVSECEGESFWMQSQAEGLVLATIGTVAYQNQYAPSPLATFSEAWAAQGASCLPELEGAFVGLVYDPKTHQLSLFNDKFGMRPIFVVENAQYVAFCNELEPLLKLPGFAPALNPMAVANYFSLGTTLDGETLVQGITNLPAASLLRYTENARSLAPYWECRPVVDPAKTVEQHALSIYMVMQQVIPQLFAQVSNELVLVSAGADSRLLLTCASTSTRQTSPFRTSSLAVLEVDKDRDLIGAQALAKRLGLQHEILRIAFSELEFGTEYFDRVKKGRYRKIVGGWHGGEFLGGYCAQAAPIRKELSFAEVDQRLKGLLSWRLRWKLKQHPFEAYQAQRAQLKGDNQMLQFYIQQLGRAFFSSIYNGSRGSWLQPFELINQGHSPFWDSRFLQALLEVPFDLVLDYQLYNVIFRDCATELVDIPSNSPMTMRADTAIPRMTAGQDPKIVLKHKYQLALDAYKSDKATWRRHLYRKSNIEPFLQNGDALETVQFTDFEAWYRRYLGD